MSIDVTVIDVSDFVGTLAAWVRRDELYMSDVQSMVTNVIGHVQSKRQKIRCLSIHDHGAMTMMPSSRKFRAEFEIGKDVINPNNLATFKPLLSRLAPHFHPIEGCVWMTHCEIGQDLTVLLRLAKIMRVPIYAGRHLQNPVIGVNIPKLRTQPVRINGKTYGPYSIGDPRPQRLSEWEQYVRVDPDGTYKECMRPALDLVLNRVDRIRQYVTWKLDQEMPQGWP